MTQLRALFVVLCLGAGASLVGGPAEGAAQERWRVEPTPEVRIGALVGAEEDLLQNPLAGLVLSDGTIVIQNSSRGLFEVRYYAPDGTHLATAGRAGQGPFEFGPATRIHRWPGDSVFVLSRDQRYAVFGPRGEEVREGRLDIPAGPAQPDLGGIVMSPERVVYRKHTGPPMPPAGVYRSPMLVLLRELSAEAHDTLASIRGKAAFYESIGQGVRFYPYPFAPGDHLAAGGGLAWTGVSEEPVLRSFREDGSSGPTIRLPTEPRPVTGEHRQRARELIQEVNLGGDASRWARYARSMEFPDELPHFGHLSVDTSGRVWVQRYELPWAEGPQRWWVYSPDAVLLAEVEVPATALPACARGRGFYRCSDARSYLEFGDDYMLVVQQGEYDEPQVARYRIVKG